MRQRDFLGNATEGNGPSRFL